MAGTRKRLIAALAALIFLGASASAAMAAGTASGVPINNKASISYTENSVSKTVESSPTGNSTIGAGFGTDTTFTVDTKVDLSLSDGTITGAAGGDSSAVLFTLQNDGNATHGYKLSIEEGATQQFDATVKIYLDDGNGTYEGTESLYLTYDAAAGTHTYDGAYDTNAENNFGALAAGNTQKFFVVVTTPSSASNGQQAVFYPVVTTLDTAFAVETEDDADAWTATGTAQVVFADADGAATADTGTDGEISSTLTATVSAVALTVTKTVDIVSDPFNNTTNPKAIPGAILEYEVTIANAAGAANASGVTLTDQLPATLALATGQYSGSDVTVGGVGKTADAGDGDSDGVGYDSGTRTLTLDGLNINAGASQTINFRVTVQ